MKNEGPFLKTRVHPKLLYSTKSKLLDSLYI